MQNNYLTFGDVFESLEVTKNTSHASLETTIQNIIESKPFGDEKFYIFSFMKNVEGNEGVKKIFHQPRLTKPDPLPGTMLFRVDPKKMDDVEIKWILPHREAFNLYKQGKVFENEMIYGFVKQYLENKDSLKQRESDDLTDDQIREIYRGKRQRFSLVDLKF